MAFETHQKVAASVILALPAILEKISMPEGKKIDFSSLKKAIFQLQDALTYYTTNQEQEARFKMHMRAAAIQAFEFTYELCLKMLTRYLKMTESVPNEIDHLPFPELIRLGSLRGLLLSDLTVWKDYRAERGTTSHTYDEKKATDIFKELPEFLKEAKHLLKQLEKHNPRI